MLGLHHGIGLFDIPQQANWVSRCKEPAGPRFLEKPCAVKWGLNAKPAPNRWSRQGGLACLQPDIEATIMCRRISAVAKELPERALIVIRLGYLVREDQQTPGCPQRG